MKNTRTRREQGSRFASLLALLTIALLFTPAASAGMQKIPDSVAAPTPMTVDSEIRDTTKSRPWDKNDEGEEEATATETTTGTKSVEETGGSFVDATFGYTVEFPAPWSHTGTYDEEDAVTEYLEIRGQQGGIYVTGYDWTGEYTVREYIEWWATAEYSQDWLPGGQSLRYSTSATQGVVVHISEPTDDYPEPWVYVTELHAFDGYALEIVYFAPISLFEESYPLIEGGLLVNGVNVLGQFGFEEIESMLPAS